MIPLLSGAVKFFPTFFPACISCLFWKDQHHDTEVRYPQNTFSSGLKLHFSRASSMVLWMTMSLCLLVTSLLLSRLKYLNNFGLQLKFGSNIHFSLRINCNNFGDRFTPRPAIIRPRCLICSVLWFSFGLSCVLCLDHWQCEHASISM